MKASGAVYPGMAGGVRYHYDRPFCSLGDAACQAAVGGAQENLKGRLSYVEDL